MEPKEDGKEVGKCLDSQLWHACAGGMVNMPKVNSKVVYFPQGHAEHSCGPVDFRGLRSPPYVLCRVLAIKFLADPETDEVFAKMRLAPVNCDELGSLDEDECLINGREMHENKPSSFAKTLTQSDANNGGGFSVPRYCAETIFPRLDYSADPPVQTILAKDVHGEIWNFRHIYRGTPRRHLLTTGWSTFVNHKKLVAGDSIVFLRANNGDLCVGIRRAKRGIGGGPEPLWNPAGGNCIVPYGGFAAFMREDENKLMQNGNGSALSSNGGMIGRRNVKPESVIEAATLAAKGQPFEVVYFPRASTPEFCVKASLVKAALQVRWSSGMRFKMPFETEDSSRISWFMGSISSVQVADPLRWPESPWRLLQVNWDEPDLLQNVKRVSPWLVELVSNMPAVHLSPFLPPGKKLKLPHHPAFDGQIPMPTFSSNVLGPGSLFRCLPDNSPASMQGARHDHHSLPLPDLHLNKMHAGLFLAGFPPLLDHSATYKGISNGPVFSKPTTNESVSGVLTMSHSAQTSKKADDTKAGQFVLFGKPILTEPQISLGFSGDATSPVCTGNSSSDGNLVKMGTVSDVSGSDLHQQCHPDRPQCEGFPLYANNCKETDSSLDTSPCKVYLDSEDSGRTLNLSVFRSYEELNRKLADMFGIENLGSPSNLIYFNDTGAVKQVGDEPFGDFMKAARRLTILMDSSSDNVRM